MAFAVDAIKPGVAFRPLRSNQLVDTLLPTWLALPTFCSNPISSAAYATDESPCPSWRGVAAITHRRCRSTL